MDPLSVQGTLKSVFPHHSLKRQNGGLKRLYKIAEKRREEKERQRRKGKIYLPECRVPKNRKKR